MAFRETCAMEERIGMLSDYDTGAFSVTELSERYGVSRETFYLWRERRLSGDAMWFQDRSHAPRNIPGRTEATMIERIVALRYRFPHFGPKKLRFRLQLDSPELDWPALSTIGDILARPGVVEKVRRQRRPIPQGAPAAAGGGSARWVRGTAGAAICWRYGFSGLSMKRSGLFSSAFSGTSGFPTRSAPTTVRRSDRRAPVGFRDCRYGC